MPFLIHLIAVRLSRIQIFVAAVISAMAGTALAQYLPHPFADIPPEAYFSEAVGKWWRRGVIKGYDNTHFGPDDPVTRAQMAVILDRFDTNTIESLRQEIMQINRVLQRSTDQEFFVPPYKEFSPLPPEESNDPSSPGISDLPPIESDVVCVQKKDDLSSLFDKYRSCQVDTDCLLFVRACGPYLTCGKPVTKNVLPTLERSVTLFEEACTGAFPVACAACVEMDVRCSDGQCISVNDATSPGERCTTYLREGEEETNCASCGNGTCESFERCTSSNCQNGACTQDCGGLYCPGDCD